MELIDFRFWRWKSSMIYTLYFSQEQVNIKGDLDETIKATVMLCYGYSTLYAPISLIPSRLEATILHSINPHFSNIKVGDV